MLIPNLTETQTQAANELVPAVIRRLRTGEGVHAETSVAAAARMAGSYLLRSRNLPLDGLPPGSIVPAEIDEHAIKELVTTLDVALASFGIAIDRSRVPSAVPEDHQAHHSLLQMQLMFRQPFQMVVERHGLDDRNTASAAAAAAAMLIRDSAAVFDPHVAFSVAVNGFVEGARIVPLPAPEEERRDNDDKPWWKFW